MDELRDDVLNEPAELAASLLREEVPVRRAWRDELIARIEREPAVRTRGWTIRPSLAIAAGLLLLAIGIVAGRTLRVTSPTVLATSTTPAVAKVRFVFVAPSAANVSVVGDFNHWNPTALPLRRLGDGTWIVDVPLEPGRYTYAFVVDGKIEVDPTAPMADDGDFGANSVLMVRGS